VLKLAGEKIDPVIRPKVGDRRFMDNAWEENVLFDFIKQMYLLTAEHALGSVESLEGITPRHRDRLAYYMRQLVNAYAPTNFAVTNPEVLRKTFETKGENLLQGLRMMVEDKKKSADILNVCMSKPNAFEVGRNIASTPGAVVAENELMQLIQYTPATAQVRRTPVLIVPSWVNKYYILDLTAKNSFIQWLVEQGHTVFTISWVNPDAEYRHVQFSDYMNKGPLAALDMIERLTGERQVSAVGYCLGGILLACTLAYTDSAQENRFASATYLAASMDFSDPGDIGIFIDEPRVESVERQMQRQGYFDGRLLAAGFNLLKENDLFWNYYVINYLKGERPAAFDLLHWNSDSTNVPEATHRFIMRDLHLNNGLMNAGSVTLNGRAIDLGKITTPTYILAADKDHIARWRSCYAATQLQGGPVRFVLAGSGHIAGVINPPQASKYYFYRNPERPASADEWLDSAFKVEGSWWPDWLAWEDGVSGPMVPARTIDSTAVIEPAPGRYVQQRLDSRPVSDRAAA
jgi:polyhydroxyalkanoate synthase